MNFKKITILYADDIWYIEANQYTADEHVCVYSEAYEQVKMSNRIKWVEELCQAALKREINTFIVANDYSFIRLIEAFTPSEHFCIYHCDSDCLVDSFVDLKPNPTLEVGEFVFRESVKKALKGN